MKIALVPLNPLVGDLKHNALKILEFTNQAVHQSCDLVIFPELAVLGYPPRDYLYYKILLDQHSRWLAKIKQKSKKIAIIVGGVSKNFGKGRALTNEAFVFINGQTHRYAKQLLPNYDVFDEERYFEPGTKPLVVKIGGKKFGISICEDIWFEEEFLKKIYHEDPLQLYQKSRIDFLVNISASPFELDKIQRRNKLLKNAARKLECHVIYVNQAGANDELVFDGSALVYHKNGKLVFDTPFFKEDLFVFDSGQKEKPHDLKTEEPMEFLKKALVMGIHDYVLKTGHKQVILGLSGGIDSAVVCCLASEALGPESVLAVSLPSRFSSKTSVSDSRELTRRLGVPHRVIGIEEIHAAFEKLFEKIFKKDVLDITRENIQARIRACILMAISNNSHRLLLNTTNKSEMAVGYGTLYGDMCGALAVISDLTKTQVYNLAEHLNKGQEIIPQNIITKPPSAELKPQQKDEDTLPPYPVLDSMIEDFIARQNADIRASHPKYPPKEIISKILMSEYKRDQAPIGLKVTGKAFGTGRRIPIAGRLNV